jgi:hypothetical protein
LALLGFLGESTFVPLLGAKRTSARVLHCFRFFSAMREMNVARNDATGRKPRGAPLRFGAFRQDASASLGAAQANVGFRRYTEAPGASSKQRF